MSTLSDARREALEAQGFTGALPELTLQWLQANGATSDQLSDAWMEMLNEQYLGGPPQQPNLHVNPSLVGGGVSGPGVGSFPPDGYTIGFNTVTAGPHEDGWITNPDEDTGRSYLAYSIQDNHPDLVVGQTYAYRVRVANTSTAGNPVAITVTGDANITVEAITDRVPLGQTTWLHVNITIDAAGYTGQIRVGTGITSNRPERYVIQRGATFRDTEELPDGREMPGQRNDLWYAHLGELGYVGSLPDRELQFWLDGGLFYPPLPESQWTIGQSGDDYGYGPGYGGLNPDGTVDLTVLILSADAGSNLVTMAFSGPVLYQGLTVAAEGIGVTNLLPIADDTYNAVDPAFTAAVVAALGTTVPVAVLPTGAVIPPQWTSSIPNGRVYLTDTYTYNVSRHIGYHPYFPVTGYSLAPGAPAGATITNAGIFTLSGEPEDNYSITVIATNLVGDTPSNVFTIEVFRLAPVIDTQPQDVEVLEPAPATFTVEASHPRDAELFPVWQAHDGDGAWGPVGDVLDPVPGTDLTLKLELATTSFDQSGSSVRCAVRAYAANNEQRTNSEPAQLTVDRVEVPPVIDVQPVSQIVVAPAGTSFEVQASHPDDADLFYQWQVWADIDTGWVDAEVILDVAGGTDTAPLMVLGSTTADQNNSIIRCQVYAYEYGSDQFVDSSIVLLSVTSIPQTDPVIDQHPEDDSAAIGADTQFTVEASHPDGALLLYQWEQSFVDATGINTPVLTVNNVSENDNGLSCRCRVRAYNNTGDYQVFSDWAELTVTSGRFPPDIDEQPTNAAVLEGDTAAFSVVASHIGNADLFYFWQCRGLNTPGSWWSVAHSSEGLSSVEGEDTPNLLVTNAELTDNRDIRVTVYAYENQSDEFVISNEVSLEVIEAGEAPIWGVVPDEYYRDTDLPDTVDMSQFILSGLDLENWALSGNPPGITIDNDTGLVTIADDTPPESYSMTCTVENLFGSDTSNAFTWEVRTMPVIVTQPDPLVMTEPLGGTLEIEVTHPVPGTQLWYWWEGSDDDWETWRGLSEWFSDISGNATDTCVINTTDERDFEATPIGVRCVVQAYAVYPPEEEGFRVFSEGVEVDVDRPPPTITSHPEDVETDEGEPAEFSVTATHVSGADIYYRWLAQAEGSEVWLPAEDVIANVEPGSERSSTLSISEGDTEPPPEDTVPQWRHVGDAAAEESEVDTYTRAMAPYVTSSTPLVDWETNWGSITAAGVWSPPPGTLEGDYPVTVTVSNELGPASSNQWSMSIVEDGEEEPFLIVHYPLGTDKDYSSSSFVDPPGTSRFFEVRVITNRTPSYEWEWSSHIPDENVEDWGDGRCIFHDVQPSWIDAEIYCTVTVPGLQPHRSGGTGFFGSIYENAGPPNASDWRVNCSDGTDPRDIMIRDYRAARNTVSFELLDGPGYLAGEFFYFNPELPPGDYEANVRLTNSQGTADIRYEHTKKDDSVKPCTGNPGILIHTPTPLEQLPLVWENNIRYVGGFRLPKNTPDGSNFENGCNGPAFDIDNKIIYLGNIERDWAVTGIQVPTDLSSDVLAEIAYPRIEMWPAHSGSSDNDRQWGGGLHYNNRYLFASFNWYHQNPEGIPSVSYAAEDLTSWAEEYFHWEYATPGMRHRNWGGMVMGLIPEEWQTALGGPAFTGAYPVSLLSKIPNGFSFFSFDPDDVGSGSIPNNYLLGYAQDKAMGDMGNFNPMMSRGYDDTHGYCIPTGTRSLLISVVMSHGRLYYKRRSFCTPPSGDTAEPKTRMMYAYDLLELAKVYSGERDPNDVMPYARWNMPLEYQRECASRHSKRSTLAFDPSTNRIYIGDAAGFPNDARVWVMEVVM